jgi:hypothetical protein
MRCISPRLVHALTAAGFALVLFASCNLAGSAPASKTQPTAKPLDSLRGLDPVNTRAEIVTYRGRRALHLSPQEKPEPRKTSMMALVNGTDFHNGTIEAEVAGLPITAMDDTARGFVGIEFRVGDHGARAENIYIRPTNGRADDQLRRNHSVQYESFPDFPWDRLRREQPGVYESYADLEPGAWTKMKITVAGTKARLYLNGAAQPCLIVNDLKLGDVRGQIALWAFISSNAYFSNLKITRTD